MNIKSPQGRFSNTFLDLTAPTVTDWEVSYADLSPAPTTAANNYTRPPVYDVDSNRTLYLGLNHNTLNNAMFFAGVKSDGTPVESLRRVAPGFTNGSSNSAYYPRIFSTADDVLCVSYLSTEPQAGGSAMARYEVVGDILLESWRWFGGNPICPTVDGSGNTFFAGAPVFDISNLGKKALGFIVLMDDDEWSITNIDTPSDEAFLRSTLDNHRTLEAGASPSYDFYDLLDESPGGDTRLVIHFGLTIEPGTTDGTALLTLVVNVDGDTQVSSHGPGIDIPITYTLDDVDLNEAGVVTLETSASAAARSIQFDTTPPPEQMILPAVLRLAIS